jgi:hypothetical protein
MPAKKAAAQRAQGSDMGNVWKWVYLIGLIVAGLAGAFAGVVSGAQPYLGYLLLLAAILSGIFFLDAEDLVNFAIRVLLFFAVVKGFDAIPAVGPYLSGFFTGVWGFLAPAGLTLLIVYFWKKYFGNMM